MLKNTIWNDDSSEVYGLKNDFENENEFVTTVVAQFNEFEGKECIVKNVRVETCISTCQGLQGETLLPMSMTDVEVANYYTADVCELEDEEIPIVCDSCGIPLSEDTNLKNDGFCNECLNDKYEP